MMNNKIFYGVTKGGGQHKQHLESFDATINPNANLTFMSFDKEAALASKRSSSKYVSTAFH
jgi:hypothetical protein